MIETISTVAGILITGIPKLIDAIKAGKDPSSIKLGDFISSDAIKTIDGAIAKAKSFEDKFS